MSASVLLGQPTGATAKKIPRVRRLDIEGLRAVAVLSVLAYHAKVPGFTGGFVGVDVFFVISGFLITSLLVAEVQGSGRLDFGRFYARRAVRILPPAGLVLALTATVMPLVFTPLRVVSASWDVLSAALYVVNWRFIAQQTNYLHAGSDPSPVLHFWSLAVEEQFYLVWPLVVLAAGFVAIRSGRSRAPYLILFSAVAAVSFAFGVRWTYRVNAVAYMSSFSRAWEFALGGIVALIATATKRRVATGVGLVGWAGLGAIVLACVRFSDATMFPGYAALVPVLGACAVIWAGSAVGSSPAAWAPGPLLSRAVPTWIGRLSYSWYLWHWPVLILAQAAIGPLSWPNLAAITLISAVPAWLSLKLFEQPLRASRVISARAGNGISIGLTATLVACVCALLVGSSTLTALREQAARAKTVAAGTTLSVGANSGPVTPSPLDAKRDTSHVAPGCFLDNAPTAPPRCLLNEFGALTDKPIDSQRVVLFGDSHADEWLPTAQAVAKATGWSIEYFAKAGCPLADVMVKNAQTGNNYVECATWKRNVFNRLASEPAPRLILIGSLNTWGYNVSGESDAAGWTRTMRSFAAIDAPVVYLRDNPTPGTSDDVPQCISAALNDWSKCSFPRAAPPDPLMQGTPPSHGLAARVDLFDVLCPPSLPRCPAVLNGVLLYRDISHVTNVAMNLLAPLALRQLEDDGLVPSGGKT
jgi:peptidoglycan/LPS O-acetylase OafA/YrhL